MIEFSVAIDGDDDWTFTDEVSCVQFSSMIGMKSALDRVAAPCQAEVVMFSEDAENARVGRFVQISAEYDSSSYVIYTGVIQKIGRGGIATHTRLDCLGRWANGDGVMAFPAMVNVTADEVIDYVLENAGLARRLARHGTPDRLIWILGRGELGTSTVLGGYEGSDLETGIETFNFVGDEYAAASPRQIVTDAVRADWGWFFEAKDGTLRFVDRQSPIASGVPDFTIAGVSDFRRVQGGVVNEVVVGLSPVYLVENVTLWTSAVAMRFKEGFSERHVAFRDSDGRPVGVFGELSLMWSLYDASVGGSLVVDSYDLRVTADGAGALIQVDNQSGDAIFLQVGAVIEGDGLYHDERVEFVSRDQFSINMRGVSRLPLDLPSFANPGFADDLADVIASEYANPSPLVEWFELRSWSPEVIEQQLDIDLLDVVRVDVGEGALNHLVIGIEQIWAAGVLRSGFYCAVTSQAGYWILGRSRLGLDTVLGF